MFALWLLQAFIGRSFALLRPWGLFMSSIRALAARNRGRSGRRRALLIGTYRCAPADVFVRVFALEEGLAGSMYGYCLVFN
jgi:hypothetical protein